jgi:hypothetical protein
MADEQAGKSTEKGGFYCLGGRDTGRRESDNACAGCCGGCASQGLPLISQHLFATVVVLLHARTRSDAGTDHLVIDQQRARVVLREDRSAASSLWPQDLSFLLYG